MSLSDLIEVKKSYNKIVAITTKMRYTNIVVYATTLKYVLYLGGDFLGKKREHIGRYISQIYRKGNSFISKRLNELGIGSGQVMFLLELYRQDGRNQEELSDVLNIDKGTTARAIKKLEEQGFLIREKNIDDKRAYKVYLTDKSKELKNDIYAIMSSWEEVITSNLDKEESENMIILLKKICSAI